MNRDLQQLVRYTRIQEIVGDVIRLNASDVALGDMAEVENTDGESSLARVIGLDRNLASLQVFAGGKGMSTDATVQFLGRPLDVADVGDAGIINQNIQPSRPADDLTKRRLYAGGVRHVTRCPHGVSTGVDNRRRGACCRGSIYVEHLDVSPLPGEERRDRLPDARPAARDDRHLSAQLEHNVAGVEVLHITAEVNDFCLLYR